MIIAVCGIKRSGSTVQYNLIRIALEMAGYKVNICGHNYKPRKVPEGEVDLVKRHPFSKRLAEAADHIFLTDRKDEEIRESLTRFNGKPPHEGRIADMRKHLDKWREYTDQDHVYHYDDMMNADDYMMCKIKCVLGLPFLDADKIAEAFNEIELPESGQDPKSLLFHNHITSK